MKRTPIGPRFTRQLIKVNDQVCYSALHQWEFQQLLGPLVASQPSDFTPSLFPANPFADTINRKLGDLPAFANEAEQVALRMGVIAGVEHGLAYLEEVQALRQSLSSSHADGIKDDAEEEQLRLKVDAWSGQAPVKAYFRTFGYLRLLRNHYAHVNETLHPSFKTHIRSHGTSLNRFWDNGLTELHGIDFKTLGSLALTPNLTFGIMNLLRVCVLHIDAMVAETLTLAEIVPTVVDEILKPPKNRQLKVERLSSKVRARLIAGWNIAEGLPLVTREVEKAVAARLG
ncbi:MAG TPA: hypothetical protein VF645_01645 [Allosphingosinicella sp.]